MSYQRRPAHWETTSAEEHFADVPTFDSLLDRARHMVRAMAESYLHALAREGATVSPDDPVFPCPDGTIKSMNDLVVEMTELETDHLLGRWIEE